MWRSKDESWESVPLGIEFRLLAWWQALLPSEPSCWTFIYIYFETRSY